MQNLLFPNLFKPQKNAPLLLLSGQFRRGLLVLMAIVLSVFACSDDGEEKRVDGLNYPLATAKLVSHATSGLIAPDDNITVRFTAPVIKRNLIGSMLKTPVFSFTPALTGTARWQDEQTLVFTPDAEMPLRQSYDGVIDLPALFPEHQNIESLEPMPFRFSIAGREIARSDGDFELVNENDPGKIVLRGTIEFTRELDIESLKRAATLRYGARKLELQWQGDQNRKTYNFSSPELERGKILKEYTLKLDKEPLEISNDFETNFALSPRTMMQVMNVNKITEGENPGLIIEFSDDLDTRQDLSGLIRVEPNVELKIKTIDKKVYVNGPFKHGQGYTVLVSKGIRSRWATVSEAETSESLSFEDLKPQLKFSSDGVFMPSANERKIRFQTLNVKEVRLIIKRVFENNLGQFLQTEKLNSASDRNESFNSSYVGRVGVTAYNEKLTIGAERNIWKQHELDLTELIPENDDGLYLIHISFQKKDMLYGDVGEESSGRYYYGEEYYSNPHSRGYIQAHGNIYKPIMLSDIALTMKKAHQSYIIYATDIRTTQPLSGVRISLMSYQNQLIESATTDGQGYTRLDGIAEEVFYASAVKGNWKSVLKLNEMGWNLSTFDTEGESSVPGGLRAFVYTDRGVYRPGDTAHISAIVRNDDNTFPDDHPVSITVHNPRNQKVYEETKREGKDGFYTFAFTSGMGDPTGNWPVTIKAGSGTFRHQLKIETVVPYRLKVLLEPEKSSLTFRDKSLNVNLRSTYLFGAPAAGLKAELDVKLTTAPRSFPSYKGFVFTNEATEFAEIDRRVFDGSLSSNGEASINWSIPSLVKSPAALQAQINARVYEKGGRANLNSVRIPIDPYEHYVGIQAPEMRWGYLTIGQASKFPVALVNPAGDPVPGRPLTWRIYRGHRHWWWEYDSEDQYRLRYKKDETTELIAEGTITSLASPPAISFSPEQEGLYFLEVQDGEDGHAAGIFFRAYYWGSSAAGGQDAGMLTLQTDKPQYFIGEQAQVSFPVPEEGRVLVAIERGQEVVNARWYNAADVDKEMTIPINIVPSMAPTTYVSVSIIQPHVQTTNDRPIRMYGVVPLNVEDRSTRQNFVIDMPDKLRSNERFEINIRTSNELPAQLTVAVVDEGLLDITRFPTPDPWAHFFKKLRLGVNTYDMYGDIIGANKGDIFKTFSIGGGMESYRKSQLDSGKKKRFKPVAMFKGPLKTDSKGRASVLFDMPNYIGSVRVMVVGGEGNSYGRAEKAVPVKTPLMVMPTLPRILGPAEKFVVPASVFAMEESVKKATVSIKVEGPLSVQSNSLHTLTFDRIGEKECAFTVQTDSAVGQAKVTIEARSGNEVSLYEADIMVRAASPRIYDDEKQVVDRGTSVSFKIPNRGITGSNEARLTIKRRPNLGLAERLRWLIRYPYGCLEQTTSSVFPQLFLKDFLRDSNALKGSESRIDRNINAGIKRLRRYLLPSGAFAYWPSGNQAAEWATLYAGHFLIEARKKGYSVPEDMMSGWINYNYSKALSPSNHLYSTAYRLFLLALANKPNIPAMNLLKENSAMEMGNREKWLLAAAFKLSGNERSATQILRTANTNITKQKDYYYSYGSVLRDQSVVLCALVLMEDWQQADEMAKLIGDAISLRSWYSTQTLAFSLLGLGQYLDALEGKSTEEARLVGRVQLPNGEVVPFDTEDRNWVLPLEEGFGKRVTVELQSGTTVPRGFATLSWNGIPLIGDVVDESRNLELLVEWLNEDGQRIRPEEIQQGKTFWGHFKVKNPRGRVNLKELALVQVLPSGWEIENTRLSGEALPKWAESYRLNNEEYVDVRDDRIMWFFDLNYRGSIDFLVKLNAVTVGDFIMPPTTTEAMYDNTYQARKGGGVVTVTPQ